MADVKIRCREQRYKKVRSVKVEKVRLVKLDNSFFPNYFSQDSLKDDKSSSEDSIDQNLRGSIGFST